MSTYSLTAVNNSSNDFDVCVFQAPPPDLEYPNVMSLAWFVQRWPQDSKRPFVWGDDYSFVWSQTSHPAPGLVIVSSEIWPASPLVPGASSPTKAGQEVTFSSLDGGFTFRSKSGEPPMRPGYLAIHLDSSVPLDEASVGFAMGGAAAFVANAQPNMRFAMKPGPEYWVTVGKYQPGQVLDLEEIANSVKVEFPAGQLSVVVTLGRDNTWTVSPS